MRRNRSEKSVEQRGALDSRLSGYSAGARVAAAARRLRSRTGNWPVYAAAAGSALAMTTSASASIISGVYTGTGPNGGVSVQPTAGNGSSVKGLLFPPGEINIKATAGSTFVALSVEGILPLKIFEGPLNSQYAKNFAAGANISAAAGILAASGARIAKAFFSGSSFGSFLAGQPGYVGFALDMGSGNIDYGWLKLEVTNSSGVPQILEALGYGIETTANTAIKAGDTGPGPVPEPGTMALGVLAAGAAGVVALRRRRQNA